MPYKAPAYVNSEAPTRPLSVKDIEAYSQHWLHDYQFRQHSTRTIEFRQHVVDKLLWFLNQHERTTCGLIELREFLAYVASGHQQAGGRWDNPLLTKAVRPATVHRYYRELRTLFHWLVDESILVESPIEHIRPPKVPRDQVKPFTRDQIDALLLAAGQSQYPRRDTALILFMLDTGARASEVAGAKVSDLDLRGHSCIIHGKGNKRRTVYFGRATTKALLQYLRDQERSDSSPIFLAEGGKKVGQPLGRSGLLQLIRRLGRSAGLQGVRCSPHTFRHTFAVEFLRAGGNLFSLQMLMGHSGLSQTQRYVALAQADLEAQARQFSPADRLKRTR